MAGFLLADPERVCGNYYLALSSLSKTLFPFGHYFGFICGILLSIHRPDWYRHRSCRTRRNDELMNKLILYWIEGPRASLLRQKVFSTHISFYFQVIYCSSFTIFCNKELNCRCFYHSRGLQSLKCNSTQRLGIKDLETVMVARYGTAALVEAIRIDDMYPFCLSNALRYKFMCEDGDVAYRGT